MPPRLWWVLGCLCGCEAPGEAGGLVPVPVSAYRCSVPASAWPNPRPRPGPAREAARSRGVAARHPPSSGRCLAPCDGRTSVQRRPPLTADTLGHLHYPELGMVEYKPSHIGTCGGTLGGNYSCPRCILCLQFHRILLSVGSSKTWRKLSMAHIWHGTGFLDV